MKHVRRRRWWLGVVLALSGGYVAAQEGPFLEDPKADPPAAKSGAEPAKPAPSKEPTVEFEFREKRWKDVLEWLGQKTGLPINSSFTPPGTYTYAPPRIPGQPAPTVVPLGHSELSSGSLHLIRRMR